MAGRCNNCGAELFERQQFCRRCGSPTGLPASGDLPTQLFGAGGAPQTGEVSGANTDSVNAGRATSYYPQTPQGPRPAAFPPPAPPRRKSRRWLLAFTILGFAGAIMLVSLIAAIATRDATHVSTSTKADVKERVKREVRVAKPGQPMTVIELGPGEEFIDEAGAKVSDDETVVKRTYELKPDAELLVKNLHGPVKVEGWDEPRAEVTITKRGGSAQMRSDMRLVSKHEGGRLALQTAHMPGGPFEVEYELKVPRAVRKLEINSVRSDVEVAHVAGAVSIELKQGNIELEGLSGPVRTNLINGDTEVELKEGPNEPSVFKSINGTFELHLPSGINADLEAEVTNGSIDLDDDLKLEVVKRPGSQKVSGRVGQGGRPVLVKIINGTIRIRG